MVCLGARGPSDPALGGSRVGEGSIRERVGWKVGIRVDGALK